MTCCTFLLLFTFFVFGVLFFIISFSSLITNLKCLWDTRLTFLSRFILTFSFYSINDMIIKNKHKIYIIYIITFFAAVDSPPFAFSRTSSSVSRSIIIKSNFLKAFTKFEPLSATVATIFFARSILFCMLTVSHFTTVSSFCWLLGPTLRKKFYLTVSKIWWL